MIIKHITYYVTSYTSTLSIRSAFKIHYRKTFALKCYRLRWFLSIVMEILHAIIIQQISFILIKLHLNKKHVFSLKGNEKRSRSYWQRLSIYQSSLESSTWMYLTFSGPKREFFLFLWKKILKCEYLYFITGPGTVCLRSKKLFL